MTHKLVLDLIAQARRQEAQQGLFSQAMAARLAEVQLVADITHADPVSCLVRFVEDYVELAPQLLECIQTSAAKIGRAALFSPFLDAAYGAFSRPSILLARFDGLDALLVKAYLCHRLMEEMHENNRSIRNANLVNSGAAHANILAHHLIGEPFANELDNATLITVHQLMSSPAYYDLNLAKFAEEIRDAAGEVMRHRLETLLTRNQIVFRFSYPGSLS
ncbi:hypothetical protein [Hydrocarboniclastica marina]|uniref:Uncharacterized protein n=1 Tax=Hydrocarboniclastica marina TaxID=2259620 RepID=A0A4P7XCM9_9ALTE|nr:hypothetical protein [Hydrocarboniclastica marina]MAM00490.1 hypothetical protein [Alteromonadaceae bacterium]QCF24506.1 hypothetical protein soil367_00205 [Hydrocarboniclastica marina]|tara:strand:+ start:1016 stop:1672 length:657 start_codon:yes stop_codon:yes gene_type:complete